jgi:hypothetical protein
VLSAVGAEPVSPPTPGDGEPSDLRAPTSEEEGHQSLQSFEGKRRCPWYARRVSAYVWALGGEGADCRLGGGLCSSGPGRGGETVVRNGMQP